jgi:hypothetical protein
MAGTTGLEPATSAVTGQRSNQLNYVPREKPQRSCRGLRTAHRNSRGQDSLGYKLVSENRGEPRAAMPEQY